jgi:hypothetical protein
MPRLRIRDAGGTMRTIVGVKLRDADNVLRTIKRIRVRHAAGVPVIVFGPLQATVNPAFVSGSFTGSSPATSNITTGSATVSVTGGASPFTYAWALYGSSPYTWAIGSAAAATTNFTANSVESGVYTEADFQVTVTDANGATATALVTAGANNQGATITKDPKDIDKGSTL